MSAGNSGADACNYSPAGMGGLNSAENVLTVAASDIYDTKPSWSNYGLCVGISAPGKGILSLWATSNSATAVLDGTSMASPFAAGVAALVLQSNNTLTVADVYQLILNWATPNIIVGTSFSGGGKNLLYSPIVFNEAPPTVPPTPPSPQSSPTPSSSGGGIASLSMNSSLLTIVVVINTFIFLLYV